MKKKETENRLLLAAQLMGSRRVTLLTALARACAVRVCLLLARDTSGP